MIARQFFLIAIFAIGATWVGADVRGPVRRTLDQPNIQNWVQESGSVRMNITNQGIFGNAGPQQVDRMLDPCPPGTDWAPSCEFPSGSDQQYFYLGGLWIGALIDDGGNVTPRVSVATDGWLNPAINEFYPAEGALGEIARISNEPNVQDCFGEPIHSPDARANFEVSAVFTDTLTDAFWVEEDPIDGDHQPLGLEVKQTSMTWNDPAFSDFIIVEYRIRNIGESFLKNLYVGFYADVDCGPSTISNHYTDDVAGFLATDPASGDTVEIAYIADGDGRPPQVSSGPFDTPHSIGIIGLSGSEDNVRTSFNWWISNGDIDYDFGPAWSSYADSNDLGMGWTQNYGTPMGDERKYQLMRNGERDYDQAYADSPDYIAGHPQIGHDPVCNADYTEAWSSVNPAQNAQNIANGFDARFLVSWGPIGIFDYTGGDGCNNYRLNPGDEYTFTIALLLGPDFHDQNNPQPNIVVVDPSWFDFSGLVESANQARNAYDQILGGGDIGTIPLPQSFALYQNYPNPFNPTTTISFALPAANDVTLKVYDIMGREVTTLLSGRLSGGEHSVEFDGGRFASGIYFYRLQAGNLFETRKMVLLK